MAKVVKKTTVKTPSMAKPQRPQQQMVQAPPQGSPMMRGGGKVKKSK